MFLCLLMLAAVLTLNLQWFGCVGRAKVMFKDSLMYCGYFRVRLKSWLCDHHKFMTCRLFFLFSPLLFIPPSHLPALYSDLPINLFLSLCLFGVLTELTVALAGLIPHHPQRPALCVC